jgi:hypothetical protein
MVLGMSPDSTMGHFRSSNAINKATSVCGGQNLLLFHKSYPTTNRLQDIWSTPGAGPLRCLVMGPRYRHWQSRHQSSTVHAYTGDNHLADYYDQWHNSNLHQPCCSYLLRIMIG